MCGILLTYSDSTVEKDYSLCKIELDFYVEQWLSDIQVGHALDICLAHRHYLTLIDPNRKRWMLRRWETNGWVSGHVEANQRASGRSARARDSSCKLVSFLYFKYNVHYNIIIICLYAFSFVCNKFFF